jgi:hypothetical protein
MFRSVHYGRYYIPTALNINGYINQNFGRNKKCVYDLTLIGTDNLHHPVVEITIL